MRVLLGRVVRGVLPEMGGGTKPQHQGRASSRSPQIETSDCKEMREIREKLKLPFPSATTNPAWRKANKVPGEHWTKELTYLQQVT